MTVSLRRPGSSGPRSRSPLAHRSGSSPTLAGRAAAVAGVLALVACGSQDAEPISQAGFIGRLQDGGLSEPFAECVADRVYPQLDDSDKEALARDDAASDEQETVLVDLVRTAGEECQAQGLSPGD